MSNFSNIRNKRKKELLNEFKQIYTLSKDKESSEKYDLLHGFISKLEDDDRVTLDVALTMKCMDLNAIIMFVKELPLWHMIICWSIYTSCHDELLRYFNLYTIDMYVLGVVMILLIIRVIPIRFKYKWDKIKIAHDVYKKY